MGARYCTAYKTCRLLGTWMGWDCVCYFSEVIKEQHNLYIRDNNDRFTLGCKVEFKLVENWVNMILLIGKAKQAIPQTWLFLNSQNTTSWIILYNEISNLDIKGSSCYGSVWGVSQYLSVTWKWNTWLDCLFAFKNIKWLAFSREKKEQTCWTFCEENYECYFFILTLADLSIVQSAVDI